MIIANASRATAVAAAFFRAHFISSSIRRRQQEADEFTTAVALVANLKSSAVALDLAAGQHLHALAIKAGLESSSLLARNALLNHYAKCGRLEAVLRLFSSAPEIDTASCNIVLAAYVKADMLPDARAPFEEIPRRDTVSFTTLIMGLSRASCPGEDVAVFRDMLAARIRPNEVTLATVISACGHLRTHRPGTMAHAAAVKNGFVDFVLVGTNC